MKRPGRNDPCCCGSGKKYELCCLRRHQNGERRSAVYGRAINRAYRWLEQHHSEAVHEELASGFLGSFDDPAAFFDDLSAEQADMVLMNGYEWVLAEGVARLEDGEAPFSELLLGPGGLLFDVEQRAWIEELASRSMGLYEVREARPGDGAWVADALEHGGPRCWVDERSASHQLQRGDIVGARLLGGDPWVLSGALYLFRPVEALELKQALRRELGGSQDERHRREILSAWIIEAWLELFTAPPPLLVDGGSGEAIELVTDHYQVEDPEALRHALDGQPDVEGSWDEGWSRLESPGARSSRVKLGIVPVEGDRLEVYSHTHALADEGRQWLAEVAGTTIRFRAREITDPLSAAAPGPDADEEPLPAEVSTALAKEICENFYRNWADEPVPALGNQTPRQAVDTPEGRMAVIDLLKSYEHGEAEQARRQERHPVSLQALWDAVGLRREDLL